MRAADVLAKRLDAGMPRFVTQQAFKPFRSEALLPTPNAGLGLAGLAHDPVRASALGGEKNDFGAPDVLLRSIALVDQSPQAATVERRNGVGYSGAHRTDSHTAIPAGIPTRIQMSDLIH